MDGLLPRLPARSLNLSIPKQSVLKAWVICVAFCMPFLVGGILAAKVGLPPILDDYAIRGDAHEVPGSMVSDAEYRTHSGLTHFQATLIIGEVHLQQQISYMDFSGDQYVVHVVSSTAKPGYFSTDLALKKLVDRTILGFGAVIVCFVIAIAWILLAMKITARVKIFSAYSGQRLDPVAMRILSRETKGGKLWWQLQQTNQRLNSFPRHRDKPLFVLADGEHVLGVRPAGSDGLAYPVDAAMTVLNLSEAERREILPYATQRG